MELTQTISVAQIVPRTQAEGPGWRFALWVQGCPLRCPGCCNPEYLAFDNARPRPLAEVLAEVDAAKVAGVEGISLLGGEPFAHSEPLAMLAEHARAQSLSVMVYTGFTFAELQTMDSARNLLRQIDVLVDGRYDRTQPEMKRRWIGSRNQVVHFFTERYSPSDECWVRPNTLEMRVTPEEILVNGYPASTAQELWKGWTRRSTIGRGGA